MPPMPEPETDWYDIATIRERPACRCNGPAAIISAIVVQFGLAMIPSCPLAA